MLKTLAVAAIVGIPIALSPTPAHGAPKALVCDGSFSGGTYFSVRVPAGADCTLTGATVTHGVHAKGAANVRLIDTDVKRNVNVRGTTGLTEIIHNGCKVDPSVGNNVMVRNSHDVLICQVHAKDNIMVVRNNGFISVFANRAGAFMINRNRSFVDDNPPNPHRHPAWIRVFRNTATHFIHEFGNRRHLENRDDSPAPIIR